MWRDIQSGQETGRTSSKRFPKTKQLDTNECRQSGSRTKCRFIVDCLGMRLRTNEAAFGLRRCASNAAHYADSRPEGKRNLPRGCALAPLPVESAAFHPATNAPAADGAKEPAP